MSGDLWFEALAILVLVGANGFFALAEFSVISSRASRLARNRDDQKWGAARAEKLKAEPDRFLASIQVICERQHYCTWQRACQEMCGELPDWFAGFEK